jgi:DNA polymerase III delta prime subunit
MSNNEHFLWVEKYRPLTINDCILPQEIKDVCNGFVAQGQIPNMIMAGGAGTGKTSLCYAIARELNGDVLFINCSLETGVDVIRTKLTQFASSMSLEGNLKIVILDEVERASSAFQDALKSFQEQFAKNTRFLMTTNNINKVIAPIISRCTTIEFKVTSAEKPKLASQLFKRLKIILDENSVEFNPKVLQTLILKYYPDNRKIINNLQRYSATGSCVDIGILSSLSNDVISDLVGFLKAKDFTSIRKWVSNNDNDEPSALFRALYEKLAIELKPSSIPEVVLILSKYSYQSTSCIDHQLNNCACFVEIMSSCDFS